MSTFEVLSVRLEDVLPHTNADALELAQIGGYRAVVQKGLHKAGNLVVYVPEDSVLPDDLIDAFGFTGKLSGSKKNRVKAIKLRGELSQGLVLPLPEVATFIREKRPGKFEEMFPERVTVENGITERVWGENMDLAAILGVEKYEQPIPAHMAGKARPRPSWFPMYTDIENIKKYNRVMVDGEDIILTEKIHGTNFGAGMLREDRQLVVSSRRMVLERDENNLYWRAAIQANLEAELNRILDATGADSAIIWGEVYGPGVQHLTYGVPNGQIQFRAFDIMVGGEYVDFEDFVELCGGEGEFVGEENGELQIVISSQIPMVPILYRGPYSLDVVNRFTNGDDTLSASHTREGVVVRPAVERTAKMGRVLLKSISERYLLDKNRTDLH